MTGTQQRNVPQVDSGFVIMEMPAQAVLDQARRHRAEDLAQRESAKSVRVVAGSTLTKRRRSP
jgi:hypothetical protein